MAQIKNMAANFAAFLVSLVCVSVVLTSCSGSEEMKQVLGPQPTQYIDRIEYIQQDKLYPVLSTVLFDGQNLTINGVRAMRANVEHTIPVINMPIAQHAAATVVTDDGSQLKDSNDQLTNEELTITPSTDGSYSLFATLTPAQNYSTLTRLHDKVSMVTTHHDLSGNVSATVDGETKSSDFKFDLSRHYLLADPTVDVEKVIERDTVVQVVVRTDTLVNTVEVHDTVRIVNNIETTVHDTITVEKTVTVTDTLTVEIERFVKGADIANVVINGFGSSTGTLTMGNKQLLQVNLRHAEPVLDVEKSSLGNVSFSNFAALQWKGSDDQLTTGEQKAQSVNVKGFNYVRNEYTTIIEGSLVMVRTIYNVWGTFTNENGDELEFTMELAPSYLQKYDAPVVTPQVEDKFAWSFEDKLTYETANGVCKGMLKVTGEKKNLATGEVVATANLGRTNVIKIGHPTGLELFVTGSDIIDYSKDIRPFTGDDSNWTGTTEKSGFEITKQTMIYEFSTWFAADAVAGGKVGPQTQLYFLSCEVSFKDPETGEVVYHKVFEKNATSNSEEFLTEDALVGQTRVESDKTYKYEKSYKRTFKAYIDGQEIFAPEAISSLWTPVK